MSAVDLYSVLAAERGQELRREAAQARLAALARCCRPSTWARVLHRVTRQGADSRAARG